MNKRILFLLLVSLVFGGCAVEVKTLYDHEADFSKYKTFCWMTGCEFKFTGPSYLNDSLLRESLKTSIVEELESKGLKQDVNNPDLLVGFAITMQDEKAIIYHPSTEQPFYRPVDNRQEVTYLKGTLVLGMADNKQSKIVWESFAVSYMELQPDFSEKRIHKGIKIVLKGYPPPKHP
jgi:hypothetical protein